MILLHRIIDGGVAGRCIEVLPLRESWVVKPLVDYFLGDYTKPSSHTSSRSPLSYRSGSFCIKFFFRAAEMKIIEITENVSLKLLQLPSFLPDVLADMESTHQYFCERQLLSAGVILRVVCIGHHVLRREADGKGLQHHSFQVRKAPSNVFGPMLGCTVVDQRKKCPQLSETPKMNTL